VTLRRLFWLSLLLLAVLLVQRWGEREIRHAPGVLVAQMPVQTAVEPEAFDFEDHTVTRRARFSIRARVLGRERYRFDSAAAVSPLDLALGWGPMSDQAVLDRIDVDQSGRWYWLRWDLPPPLPEQVAMGHSGNMHMIPAERWVERELLGLRPGQVIELRGYLVDVDRDDGWQWRTSLSRNDVGDGSCEIFFVEAVAAL
jgi:hypothetical protein